ncbi:hypothetical protein F2Q69_00018839 [Brassica cretica]|uniref:Uncharacterized protein n=1 Tax=Brassica cretica TaxID=69181 RepID=A0A8S9PTM4_BRACR|nr:hypothetical protein F2Q69_00018839 [Brassica cretica]
MTPSSLSMTLSYVSLRLLSQAVVSVDDSVVCLTPSSRSVHLLCQTVVSLAPSSLSLGLLSRSRVWNLFEMCFKILDQVHVLESCLCSILLYVLEIDEYDLIVFCSVIGIALPQIVMCLRLALRRSSHSQTPATPSAHLLRRLSGFVLTLAPSRLSHPGFSVGPSSLSDPRLSRSVVSLDDSVVSLDDSVVCLTPSSLSSRGLCR